MSKFLNKGSIFLKKYSLILPGIILLNPINGFSQQVKFSECKFNFQSINNNSLQLPITLINFLDYKLAAIAPAPTNLIIKANASVQSKVTDPTIASAKSTDSQAKSVINNKATDNNKVKVTNPVNPMVIKAYEFITKGNYLEASNLLNKAIKNNPNDIEARRYLTYTYLLQGHNQDAKNELIAMTKIQKPSPFDWFLMGQFYLNENELVLAQESFRNSLYYNPYLYLARVGYIRCLINQGNPDEANNAIDEGKKLTKNKQVLNYYQFLAQVVKKDSNIANNQPAKANKEDKTKASDDKTKISDDKSNAVQINTGKIDSSIKPVNEIKTDNAPVQNLPVQPNIIKNSPNKLEITPRAPKKLVLPNLHS